MGELCSLKCIIFVCYKTIIGNLYLLVTGATPQKDYNYYYYCLTINTEKYDHFDLTIVADIAKREGYAVITFKPEEKLFLVYRYDIFYYD